MVYWKSQVWVLTSFSNDYRDYWNGYVCYLNEPEGDENMAVEEREKQMCRRWWNRDSKVVYVFYVKVTQTFHTSISYMHQVELQQRYITRYLVILLKFNIKANEN